jgi:hypothetical protein
MEGWTAALSTSRGCASVARRDGEREGNGSRRGWGVTTRKFQASEPTIRSCSRTLCLVSTETYYDDAGIHIKSCHDQYFFG